MNQHTRLTITNGVIGDGTAGPVQRFIEDYAKAAFPDSGIEYWSDHRYATNGALRPASPLPAAAELHHVAVYVRQGTNEGRIIDIALVLKNGTFKPITWAKTFGSAEESWAIARELSSVLESLFVWHELPESWRLAA